MDHGFNIERLESRKLLSAGHESIAIAPVESVVHAAVTHRHRTVIATLVGTYNTTVTIDGVAVGLSLDVDHQHLGHVSGTLDATNVPIIGTAHIAFSGVVNADNTFSLTFSGTATGTASGAFTSDYQSATVTYDFTAVGMTFSGTRTFTR